ARGAAVYWAGVDGDYSRRRVPLPTYPFQRKKYWLENARPDQPGKPLDAAPAAREEKLVYEVEWGPPEGAGVQAPPDFLPSAGEIRSRLQIQFDQSMARQES